MKHDATQPPSPRGGWSQSVTNVSAALIVPPLSASGLILDTGVFSGDGAAVDMATTWRRDRPITRPPEKPAKSEAQLAGTWLWGGVLYHHFGHFQVESIARLWAIRRFRDQISGIVFAARNGQTELRTFERDYLDQLGCDVPVQVCCIPTKVEHLIVPGQGFGLGSIASGTRVFRRFIKEDFAKDISPEGHEKLFISRSLQTIEKGGFLGEAVLDERMKLAGYDVFWPEKHSLEKQIARYKAAQRIVALDGSALHLFAMVGTSEQKLALILRRERIASRSLRRHLASFTGAEPTIIAALRDGKAELFGKKQLITALDFEHIGKVLKRRGYLPKDHDWGPLREEELAQIVS